MKLFLHYFVEFSEDGSILEKNHPKNCKVKTSDQRPIIMITHDGSTFMAMMGVEKSKLLIDKVF